MTKILTNTNKLVESKANYFADYFNWYARHLGQLFETEFENPSSLVNKIIFQIKTNQNQQRARYILNHLSHYYFSHDRFLMKFPAYKSLKPMIQQFKNVTPGKNKYLAQHSWLNNNPAFLTGLEALAKELDAGMVTKALESVTGFLQCPHELPKHKHGIQYFTKILVTQFYFTGRSEKEILDIFNRILRKKIESFPFPPEIKTDEEKWQYLNPLGLKKQFMSMRHFFDEMPVPLYLLTKVSGIRFDTHQSFTYNDVEFIHPEHEKLTGLRENLRRWMASIYDKFWNNENFIIAITPVRVYKDIPYWPQVTPRLNNSVDYLGFKMEKSLSIDSKTYFLTADLQTFSGNFGLPNDVKVITEAKLDSLNNNGFSVLEQSPGSAASHLLGLEHILIAAAQQENLDGYWRYLEYLFYPLKNEQMIETVSQLLLLEETETRKNIFVNYLFGAVSLIGFNYEEYGLTVDDLKSFRKLLPAYKTRQVYKKLNDPFFNDIRSMQYARHTKKRYHEVFENYQKLLLELYESRNSLTHGNMIDGAALLKLQQTIPLLLKQLRFGLFDLIKANPRGRFSDITSAGMAKAKQLL